jgi:hypothetical protein
MYFIRKLYTVKIKIYERDEVPGSSTLMVTFNLAALLMKHDKTMKVWLR